LKVTATISWTLIAGAMTTTDQNLIVVMLVPEAKLVLPGELRDH
jgi:hypothetical protein